MIVFHSVKTRLLKLILLPKHIYMWSEDQTGNRPVEYSTNFLSFFFFLQIRMTLAEWSGCDEMPVKCIHRSCELSVVYQLETAGC